MSSVGEKQSDTRSFICMQMKNEIVLKCSVDAFLAHYSPFLPDSALVEAAKRALMEKQLLILKGEGQLEWQEYVEEPCDYSLEANASVPLKYIAEVFDDVLEGLNWRQRHFSYRNCPNADVRSEIGNSNLKTNACFHWRTRRCSKQIHDILGNCSGRRIHQPWFIMPRQNSLIAIIAVITRVGEVYRALVGIPK
jgi:hypothetical protein